MSDVLHINFTAEELRFLHEQGFDADRELDADMGVKIVDELGYNDYGTAADIITKITTNPDW